MQRYGTFLNVRWLALLAVTATLLALIPATPTLEVDGLVAPNTALAAISIPTRFNEVGESKEETKAREAKQDADKRKTDNKVGKEQDSSTAKSTDPVTGKKVRDSSVVDYVDAIYTWSAIFGGLLAVIMVIFSGYRYMTSYGDPEKLADAKNVLEQALIGLGLLILAALILNTINPDTTKCENNCGDINFTKPGG